jgi:quercetin dioxygenase-like cupin family protein
VFPISGDNGAKTLSLIYAELEPGYSVGDHTDSAEEVIIVLEGILEIEMGKEFYVLMPGELILVPSETWHNPKNIGDSTALFLGIFASPDIESNFRHRIYPE